MVASLFALFARMLLNLRLGGYSLAWSKVKSPKCTDPKIIAKLILNECVSRNPSTPRPVIT